MLTFSFRQSFVFLCLFQNLFFSHGALHTVSTSERFTALKTLYKCLNTMQYSDHSCIIGLAPETVIFFLFHLHFLFLYCFFFVIHSFVHSFHPSFVHILPLISLIIYWPFHTGYR